MNSESLRTLADNAKHLLVAKFGREPDWIACAPGRVNLIGGHVDYNDGIVLPLAIDRYTVFAASANQTNAISIFSEQQSNTASINLTIPLKPRHGSWINYVAGVICEFAKLGHSIPGFDAVICSAIPIGGGLSSSAALEVAAATLLESITGTNLNNADKALLCQTAEHEFAGLPCGVMDQFTAVFGKANHLVKLDCRNLDVDLIPWPGDNATVLVIDSRASHQLVESEYGIRRSECDSALAKLALNSFRDLSPNTLTELPRFESRWDETLFQRTRHVVTEFHRCQRTIAAIRAGDWQLAGQQMFASHASLRDDYDVSCPELDFLVSQAEKTEGVYGMRMTGAGFGGCTVALVEAPRAEKIASTICTAYEKQFGVEPDWFVTRPAEGAHTLQV